MASALKRERNKWPGGGSFSQHTPAQKEKKRRGGQFPKVSARHHRQEKAK